MTQLKKQLHEYLAGGFTGIWVQTHEHQDALAEINVLALDLDLPVLSWDCDSGLLTADGKPAMPAPKANSAYATFATQQAPGSTPVAALAAAKTYTKELESGGKKQVGPLLLVMRNLHRFIDNAAVMQAVQNTLEHSKSGTPIHVIVLSHSCKMPAEVEKQFVVIDHTLPDRDELLEIATHLDENPEEYLPEGKELEKVLDAAAGLTRQEAEDSFSLSLVRHQSLKPDVLWEIKAQTLAKSGLMELHRGGECFEDLGGLHTLKDFCLRALSNQDDEVRAKGILLLGVPGTGKSAFSKALGTEVSRPTVTLNIGSLMGGLVGQTEENTRRALATIDSMSPCILFVD